MKQQRRGSNKRKKKVLPKNEAKVTFKLRLYHSAKLGTLNNKMRVRSDWLCFLEKSCAQLSYTASTADVMFPLGN